MNRSITIKILALITASVLSIKVLAVDIIHYKNEPVIIYLVAGQERSIKFGDHVKVGMTKGQKHKNLFRVQSAQGVLHVRPNQEFDKQRLQVKRLSDNRVILLDLISLKPGKSRKQLESVKIVLDSENKVNGKTADLSMAEASAPNGMFASAKIITPVDLTRYASQVMYGPSRLQPSVPGISQVEVGVDHAIRIFKGQNKYKTIARPTIGYTGGGYNLAAIHIKNLDENSVRLDYLDLNLPFSHATFQHHMLNPMGQPGDSTILYLVAEKPLRDTLYPWTYYRDAKIEAQEKARLKRLAIEKKKAKERRDKRHK